MEPWAGLHDNVLADLLPRWQKVHQSRASQPLGTDVPGWVTASAVQATFWDSDSFNAKCHGPSVGTQQVQPWRRVSLGRCHATQPRTPLCGAQADERQGENPAVASPLDIQFKK